MRRGGSLAEVLTEGGDAAPRGGPRSAGGARLLWRPRLIARLEAGAGRKLALIQAAGGFGKSTLVDQWTARLGVPVARLELGPRDSDPARFLARLAGAVFGALGALGDAPGRAAEPSGLAPVLARLAGAPAMLLVLDGYEAIRSDAVHRAVAELLAQTPPQVRLLIASRTDPPLPLGRLRVAGDLVAVRQPELRFTEAEAAAYLRQALGLWLAADEVAALITATGGWIAGLQLGGLALRAAEDRGALLASLLDRSVLLADALLAQLPAGVRAFLEDTAVLERKDAAACDALTGRGDGEARLRALCQEGVLCARAPEGAGSHRTHAVLDEHLRAMLDRDDPARAAELHRRAAAHLAGTGRWEEALRHALAGGDAELAADLVGAHGEQALGRGEALNLLADVEAIPVEVRARRPRLAALATAAQAVAAPASGAAPADAGVLTARVLTAREREVVALMEAGYSARETAARLQLSVETVRTHTRQILRKLGARDRAEAIRRARGEPG